MIRENINQRIAEAMKNGNKIETAAWRALKNEFLVYQTAKAGNEITDDVELRLIQKMVSQRKDSFEQYNTAGRKDLADNEYAEMQILESLLPKEPTEEEIKNSVVGIILEIDHEPSMKDMKFVQTEIKTEYPTVNGGIVAKIFKEIISK